MTQQKLVQIGEIAKMAGVNIQTLRYYEHRNILKPSSKKDSGFRLYSMDAVKTVKFIKHAQELGFKLDEIKELINLRAPSIGRCNQALKKASEKLSDVRDKIDNLKKIEKTLKKLISDCRQNKTSQNCPIIENMETN
jgi:Hg(II)-responsive transcriptional regulator